MIDIGTERAILQPREHIRHIRENQSGILAIQCPLRLLDNSLAPKLRHACELLAFQSLGHLDQVVYCRIPSCVARDLPKLANSRLLDELRQKYMFSTPMSWWNLCHVFFKPKAAQMPPGHAMMNSFVDPGAELRSAAFGGSG